jgi:hypothetical protein
VDQEVKTTNHLLVRLLNLIVARVPPDAEQLVVVFAHHDGRLRVEYGYRVSQRGKAARGDSKEKIVHEIRAYVWPYIIDSDGVERSGNAEHGPESARNASNDVAGFSGPATPKTCCRHTLYPGPVILPPTSMASTTTTTTAAATPRPPRVDEHDGDGLQPRDSGLIRRSWHAMTDLMSPFSAKALASLPRPGARYTRADAIPEVDGPRPTVRDYHAISSLPPNVRVPKKVKTPVRVEPKVWFANERSEW